MDTCGLFISNILVSNHVGHKAIMLKFSIIRTIAIALIGCVSTVSIAYSDTLSIGVLAHRGAEFALQRWRPTIAYIDARLPDDDVVLRPLSLEGVQAALDNNEINFLLTNPGHYYGVSDAFRLTKVATLKSDRGGQPATGNRYGAVIFTKANRHDIRSLGDLRDKSFAAVAPSAFGGFLAAAFTMQSSGIDPHKDLRAIKYLGFPQDEIVMAVIRGEEDAGTVRTGIIESMIAAGKISRGDIRILNPQKIDGFELSLSTNLFPEWTFAATRITSAKMRKRVAQILFAIDEANEAARQGRYGGWNTPMYDGGVRKLLLAVQKAGTKREPDMYKWIISGIAIVLLLGGGVLYWQLKFFRQNPRTASGNTDGRPFLRLTPRENEVLGLVVSGKTNKEVARALEISPKTVEFHRKHLMEKLDADSLADLVRIAIERELLSNQTG